jgi:nucleoside-diphosphate-sugar epimerase
MIRPVKPRPSDDPGQRKTDIRLAGDKIGWKPQVSENDGLKQTIEFFNKTPFEEY